MEPNGRRTRRHGRSARGTHAASRTRAESFPETITISGRAYWAGRTSEGSGLSKSRADSPSPRCSRISSRVSRAPHQRCWPQPEGSRLVLDEDGSPGPLSSRCKGRFHLPCMISGRFVLTNAANRAAAEFPGNACRCTAVEHRVCLDPRHPVAPRLVTLFDPVNHQVKIANCAVDLRQRHFADFVRHREKVALPIAFTMAMDFH